MKYTLILICLVLQSCGKVGVKNSIDIVAGEQDEQIINHQIQKDSVNGAYLSFDKKRYDFGKISRKKTPDIQIELEVCNIGKSPLVILKADVSCGCLSVDFPKEPILPGDKGKLTIYVDARLQEGAFNKTVFIKSNAENDVELIRIIGKIKK